jgi:hypothetical protein
MSVSALAAFRARRAWRAAGFQFAGECLGAGAADRAAAGTGHGTSQEPGKREPLVVGEYGLDGGNGSRQVAAAITGLPRFARGRLAGRRPAVAGLADGLT